MEVKNERVRKAKYRGVGSGLPRASLPPVCEVAPLTTAHLRVRKAVVCTTATTAAASDPPPPPSSSAGPASSEDVDDVFFLKKVANLENILMSTAWMVVQPPSFGCVTFVQ